MRRSRPRVFGRSGERARAAVRARPHGVAYRRCWRGRSRAFEAPERTPQDCRAERHPPRCTRGFIGGLRHSMSLRGGLTREADDGGRDEIGLLERFPAKWEPVRRRKRAKRKESRAVSDSNESETALAREERGFAALDPSQTPGHDRPLQGNATSACPVAPGATSTPKRWSCAILDDACLHKIRRYKSRRMSGGNVTGVRGF